MPDVELHRRQAGGQWVSISGQREALKARFSGPCSWMMDARATALGRSESMLRRPLDRYFVTRSWLEDAWGSPVLVRYDGRILRM